MNVSFLPMAGSFHAVQYNERKVGQGDAYCIRMDNMGACAAGCTPAEMTDVFTEYSSRNPRVKNAQLHLAFSCRGEEMSVDELLAAAIEWLDRMGYGHPDQPRVFWVHTDTANRHLHVVTSRIHPDGHKIDDSLERIRGRKVLDLMEGLSRPDKVHADIQGAFGYRYASLGMFCAILESMGYETYNREGTVYVKSGGAIMARLHVSDVMSHAVRTAGLDEQARRNADAGRKRLAALLHRYAVNAQTLRMLQHDLHARFGMVLVLHGPADAPTGYFIVDHAAKEVWYGDGVLPIARLTAMLGGQADRAEGKRVSPQRPGSIVVRPSAIIPTSSEGQHGPHGYVRDWELCDDEEDNPDHTIKR